MLKAIQEEEECIKQYKIKQSKFPNDKVFVQQLAHELGMAKSNEVLISFTDEKPVFK